MWLFTTICFLSAVEDAEHADTLKIRARAREDLAALRDRDLSDLQTLETDHTD